EAAVQGGSFASAALGTSYCNRREAEAVAFALELLLRGGDVEAEDVGIITPYSAQVRLLQDVGGAFYGGGEVARGRRGNKRGGIALPEIASVDGYQGREKEV
ncbi:unnamed protein product, partial [Hapterophycus canaliculatus]